ncbi:MAG: hypothetical protein F6J94_23530 [Moorea sp. SIO1F2]|uniref:hypothetical protein n=1 Tax=unclassified Moorena TaxID=2683338 RepID=UPI0013BCB6EA|nr:MULTISPECIES: hypothetical protein [unclassified Moorena]NEQ56435.1 hypothetical protein [Moorena sp. SIO4A1]NET84776.1 hypothetical protein [Moorena sp. SIO1F2]
MSIEVSLEVVIAGFLRSRSVAYGQSQFPEITQSAINSRMIFRRIYHPNLEIVQIKSIQYRIIKQHLQACKHNEKTIFFEQQGM